MVKLAPTKQRRECEGSVCENFLGGKRLGALSLSWTVITLHLEQRMTTFYKLGAMSRHADERMACGVIDVVQASHTQK